MSTRLTANKPSTTTNTLHLATWRRQQVAKPTKGVEDVLMEDVSPAKRPKCRSVPTPIPTEEESGSIAFLDAFKALKMTNVAERQARIGCSSSALPTTMPNQGASAGEPPASSSGDPAPMGGALAMISWIVIRTSVRKIDALLLE